jgi:putative phosphoesterase
LWSRKEKPEKPDPRRIGIIADSHGDLAATAEAIRLLKARGAQMLVHLGDFCDSLRPESAAAMVELLVRNEILAVKGNNDFFMENRLADERRPADAEGEKTASFLKAVPVVHARGAVRFAHSLPLDTFRAFYEPIDQGDTRRAEALFAEADFTILFCGHSHLPILFREEKGRVTREAIPAGRPLTLAPSARYIFVAGAAADGECALYDEAAATYERLHITGSGLGI